LLGCSILISALQISRDLNINPKSAFVLLHKLREAMASQVHNPDEPELSGEVQADGAYFGGHVKPENRKADRKDRRLAEEQTGKRQVVVVACEVNGRTRPFVVSRESEAVPLIRQHVASGSIIHADESNAWERLHASYDAINTRTKQLGERTTGASRTARIGIRSLALRWLARRARFGPAIGTGAQHDRE
jgi:hypothetical protein